MADPKGSKALRKVPVQQRFVTAQDVFVVVIPIQTMILMIPKMKLNLMR